MQPEIRIATRADVAELANLKREAATHVYAAFPRSSLASWHQRFSTEDYFTDRIERRDLPTTFFVMGPRGNIRGLVSLKERGGEAYIGDLYALEPAAAVSRRLVAAALEAAARQSFSRVFADVFSNNERALRFFTKLGFTVAGGYREQSLGVWVHRVVRDVEGPSGVPAPSSGRRQRRRVNA